MNIASPELCKQLFELSGPNPADLIYAKHCADKGQGALIKHYNNEDSYECK